MRTGRGQSPHRQGPGPASPRLSATASSATAGSAVSPIGRREARSDDALPALRPSLLAAGAACRVFSEPAGASRASAASGASATSRTSPAELRPGPARSRGMAAYKPVVVQACPKLGERITQDTLYWRGYKVGGSPAVAVTGPECLLLLLWCSDFFLKQV